MGMDWWQFEKVCLASAIRGKLAIAVYIAGVFSLFGTPMAIYWKLLEGAMIWLPSAICLLIFFILVAVGISRSSYDVYKKQEKNIDNLNKKLDDRGRRQETANSLANFHRDGWELINRGQVIADRGYLTSDNEDDLWKQTIETWYINIQNEIRDRMSDAEAELFRTAEGRIGAHNEHELFVQELLQGIDHYRAKLNKLRIMIGDLNTRLR